MGRRWCITRPEPEAGAWVERLRQRGIDALSLPLLAIAPAPDPAAVAVLPSRLRSGLAQAVMFVSPNAVQAVFSAAPALVQVFGAGVRAWAPGPGTARALLAQGVPASAIDQPDVSAKQYDSEALWVRVQAQVVPGFALLVIRGADAQGRVQGRDWLVEQVQAMGGQCTNVAAYARVLPHDLADRLRALDGQSEGVGWVFSSSHAVAHLSQALIRGVWVHDWSSDLVLCTHDRIARQAAALAPARLVVCRPSLDEVAASIESLA